MLLLWIVRVYMRYQMRSRFGQEGGKMDPSAHELCCVMVGAWPSLGVLSCDLYHHVLFECCGVCSIWQYLFFLIVSIGFWEVL